MTANVLGQQYTSKLMNQVKNPFSFKETFVYVGHNERRTNISDEGKPGQEDELWKRGKMAEKEWWVGGGCKAGLFQSLQLSCFYGV